jgi:hypothetical protein
MELAEYCRRIEDHLTRVNGGHLVRVVGPSFELVRQWTLNGVPLSIACHGISSKAERHRKGGSTRPLRLEFCAADVDAAFENWRRAVGFHAGPGEASAEQVETGSRKRPVGRHLARVTERLGVAGGRLELPEAFREVLSNITSAVSELLPESRRVTAEQREVISDRLVLLDDQLIAAARTAVPPQALAEFEAAAHTELTTYRHRLDPDSWHRAVDAIVSERLRERLGLPTVRL